jgi:hypothetical protein
MRIGGIAVVGFVIGIAWPKVMGVKLGPNAPQETAAATTAPAASAGAPEQPAAPATPAAAAVSANPVPAAAAGAAMADVAVKNGVLISCRTEDGATLKGRACGSVNFDGIAHPRIKRLAQCPAARGVEGRLGVTFNLDFRTNRATFVAGKSSTAQNADALLACLKPAFETVSLSAVDHEHPKYAVLYNVTFSAASGTTAAAKPTPAEAAPAAVAAADDATAQIVWEVAIVRDQPRTGQITGRLPRGSKVKLGPAKDSWYPIKFGESFGSEGWIYRAAIGR